MNSKTRRWTVWAFRSLVFLAACTCLLTYGVRAETAAEAYKEGMEAVSPGEAISHFDRAIQLDPEFGPAYHDRGMSYQMLGDVRKAIQDFDKAIEISDKNVSAYYNRGICNTIIRLYKRAIDDFSKVIELTPDDARAYNNLAWIYASASEEKFRDSEKAVEYATRAVQLTGESDAAYLDTLAEAYFANGNYEEAVGWGKKAVSLDPGSVDYANHLKRYTNALGKK